MAYVDCTWFDAQWKTVTVLFVPNRILTLKHHAVSREHNILTFMYICIGEKQWDLNEVRCIIQVYSTQNLMFALWRSRVTLHIVTGIMGCTAVGPYCKFITIHVHKYCYTYMYIQSWSCSTRTCIHAAGWNTLLPQVHRRNTSHKRSRHSRLLNIINSIIRLYLNKLLSNYQWRTHCVNTQRHLGVQINWQVGRGGYWQVEEPGGPVTNKHWHEGTWCHTKNDKQCIHSAISSYLYDVYGLL